jgi:hypothetical protein
MKFRPGDIIKCKGVNFATRKILKDPTGNPQKYITQFLEDDSVVEDDRDIIDNNYFLITKKDYARYFRG